MSHKDERKRTGIIESALREFGERGFESATIKRIAHASGVAPGSIYTYFRGKKQLFRAAVKVGWESLLEELEGVVSSALPVRERMEEILDISFRRLHESSPLLRGMLFEASRMREFHRSLERFWELMTGLIEEGQQAGNFMIDNPQWRPFVRVIISGVLFTVAVTPESETEQAVNELKTAVLSLLQSRTRRETT